MSPSSSAHCQHRASGGLHAIARSDTPCRCHARDPQSRTTPAGLRLEQRGQSPPRKVAMLCKDDTGSRRRVVDCRHHRCLACQLLNNPILPLSPNGWLGPLPLFTLTGLRPARARTASASAHRARRTSLYWPEAGTKNTTASARLRNGLQRRSRVTNMPRLLHVPPLTPPPSSPRREPSGRPIANRIAKARRLPRLVSIHALAGDRFLSKPVVRGRCGSPLQIPVIGACRVAEVGGCSDVDGRDLYRDTDSNTALPGSRH